MRSNNCNCFFCTSAFPGIPRCSTVCCECSESLKLIKSRVRDYSWSSSSMTLPPRMVLPLNFYLALSIRNCNCLSVSRMFCILSIDRTPSSVLGFTLQPIFTLYLFQPWEDSFCLKSTAREFLYFSMLRTIEASSWVDDLFSKWSLRGMDKSILLFMQ